MKIQSSVEVARVTLEAHSNLPKLTDAPHTPQSQHTALSHDHLHHHLQCNCHMQEAPCTPGDNMKKHQAIRLQHSPTRKWLHSHNFYSPLSNNLEVRILYVSLGCVVHGIHLSNCRLILQLYASPHWPIDGVLAYRCIPFFTCEAAWDSTRH